MRFLLASLLVLHTAVAAQAACRQALVLGLDVSGSVDAHEYRMQLDGVATALDSEAVQAALLVPGAAPVHLAVFEWSGPTDQTLIINWTALTDIATLQGVISDLRSFQRGARSPTTAIGSAMLFGGALLTDRTECWTRTIDISGDGESNTGPRPQDVTVAQLPPDIIVNGLVIGAGDPGIADRRAADIKELSSYYRSYVLRGPGSFVETARGFDDYAQAMERKLLRELTSLAVGQATHQ